MEKDSERYSDNNSEERSRSEDVTRNNRPERFRYTYELERYSHNAMLIITNDLTPEINITVQRLKTTFEKFRFQAEVIFELRDIDIYRRCDEYFRRDFRSYGALAVLVIPKKFSVSNEYNIILESYITQNFRMPTLKDKPVIYIAADYGIFTIKRCEGNHDPDFLSLSLPNLKQEPFEHTPFFDNLIVHLNGMANGDDLEKTFTNIIREASVRIDAENEVNNESQFIEMLPYRGTGMCWKPTTTYPKIISTLRKRILLYRMPSEM